jgi:putative phosphoesterase
MEIAILADTHVPSREPRIPDWVRERVRAADHTIHAGDFDSAAALSTVRDLAAELTAVAGNIDPGLDLPGVATVALGGVTFVVTHGTGSPAGYERRVRETVVDHAGSSAVGVCGHTHRVLDTVVDGVRLLNPGSATGADPAAEATMLTARVRDGQLAVSVERGAE